MPQDTSIKGKSFLFNAIWAAVGETEFSSVQGYRHKPVRCNVPIPLTFMFKDGEPFKALTMDKNNLIVRISPEEVSLYENARSDATNRGMKQYRNMLLDYQTANRYGECQQFPHDPILCTGINTSYPLTYQCTHNNTSPSLLSITVTYVDDEQEDLTLQRLDLLMHNDNWRQQVMLLQGYVPTVVTREMGNYDGIKGDKYEEKEKELKKKPVDFLTQSVAKVIEKAYASTATPTTIKFNRSTKSSLSTTSNANPNASGRSQLGSAESKVGDYQPNISTESFKTQVGSTGGLLEGTSNSDSINKDEQDVVDLKVHSMRAVFVDDPYGKKVLLYSDYVAAKVGRGVLNLEGNLRKEQYNREVLAAETITKDLKELFVHAGTTPHHHHPVPPSYSMNLSLTNTFSIHADKRGISPAESFSHFDLENKGLVDVHSLIAGMARLGTYIITHL